jgi:UPF0271 protein
MSTTIDLNLDAGESKAALLDGSEEALYQLVSSVNVACGGHAGDEETMRTAIQLARRYGLRIGAHPSYPDRAGFGRHRIEISDSDLYLSLRDQILRLNSVAQECGAALSHVKLHGALYHDAADHPHLARLVLEVLRAVDPSLEIVGRSGSLFINLFRSEGFTVYQEAFVDRRYEVDGLLRSRDLPGALIHNPDEAAEQALRLARGESLSTAEGVRICVPADTLCIHGDGVSALLIARAVRLRLEKAGYAVAPRNHL